MKRSSVSPSMRQQASWALSSKFPRIMHKSTLSIGKSGGTMTFTVMRMLFREARSLASFSRMLIKLFPMLTVEDRCLESV